MDRFTSRELLVELRVDLKIIDIPLPNSEIEIGLTIVRNKEMTKPFQLFIKQLKKYLK